VADDLQLILQLGQPGAASDLELPLNQVRPADELCKKVFLVTILWRYITLPPNSQCDIYRISAKEKAKNIRQRAEARW
jgi:hypothetical protein